MAPTRTALQDPLRQRNLLTLADLGPTDVSFVLGLARRLQQAHDAGRDEPLLRGRIVGVIGDGPIEPAFAAALQQLGAGVAAVSPGLVSVDDPAKLRRTAQWLGRLYDAIDCTDVALAGRLARECSVPVFGGLSTPGHPAHALGTLLTLQTLSDRPLESLRVAWHGDDRGASAWAQAAALAGMAPGRAASEADADFVVEPHDGHAAVAGRPDTADDRIALLKALLVATLR